MIAGRAQTIGAGMIPSGNICAAGRGGLRSGLVTFSAGQRERLREGVDQLLFGATAGGLDHGA